MSLAWTISRVEQLKALKAKGHTLAEVAAVLGVSLGAVVGKLNRLGDCAPGPGRLVWGDEEIARLRSLHASGASTRSIAQQMGIARSTAFEKMKSIGLETNREPGRVHPHQWKTVEKPPHLPIVEAVEISSDDDAVIPKAQRKSLVELTDVCCHWPVGEVGEPGFFFCGAVAVEGLPYCHTHSRRAYKPRERKPSENRRLDARW